MGTPKQITEFFKSICQEVPFLIILKPGILKRILSEVLYKGSNIWLSLTISTNFLKEHSSYEIRTTVHDKF